MSGNHIRNRIYSWASALISLFKREPRDRDQLIEIMRDSEKRNLLDPDALAMVEGALQVSDMQVRDIMIPRVQMIMVKNSAEPKDILNVVLESGHSRFPVLGDDADEILGILMAKDLLFY